MIDIGKQVVYWLDGAVEEWEVAQELFRNNRVRHALFFAHLALEKLLKAHFCHHAQDLAPRTHNLVRLAELVPLSWNQEQIDFLAEMNAFNIEGRYPDTLAPPPSVEEAEEYLDNVAEVYEWLSKQLPRL